MVGREGAPGRRGRDPEDGAKPPSRGHQQEPKRAVERGEVGSSQRPPPAAGIYHRLT